MRKMLDDELRFTVLRRDNYTCRYCGAKAPDVQLEVDHVVPASDGGSSTVDNLVTACLACNRGKGIRSAVVPTSDARLEADYAWYAARLRELWEQESGKPCTISHENFVEFLRIYGLQFVKGAIYASAPRVQEGFGPLQVASYLKRVLEDMVKQHGNHRGKVLVRVERSKARRKTKAKK